MKFMTEEIIGNKFWKYYHRSGEVSTYFLRFLSGGRVGNYHHQNEAAWCIDRGTLCFMDHHGAITIRFESVDEVDGRLLLSGPYVPEPSMILCLEEQTERWPAFPGTRSNLAHVRDELGWEIGEHTYGLPGLIEQGLARLHIGKYTSIAADVYVSFGDHRTDTVSSYPFLGMEAFWLSVPKGVSDHRSKGDVHIGNDVWIGQGVYIGSGVTIGDGAVIGTKTVVTRNVPPYAIYAGNPGRIVRMRFSDEIIADLLEIAWWKWPDRVVDSFLPLIMSNDIEAFIRQAKARRSETG